MRLTVVLLLSFWSMLSFAGNVGNKLSQEQISDIKGLVDKRFSENFKKYSLPNAGDSTVPVIADTKFDPASQNVLSPNGPYLGKTFGYAVPGISSPILLGSQVEYNFKALEKTLWDILGRMISKKEVLAVEKRFEEAAGLEKAEKLASVINTIMSKYPEKVSQNREGENK